MKIKQIITREKEIRQASADYPGLEIGEAYKLWKKARSQKPIMLSTKDLAERQAYLTRFTQRPCDRPGCLGIQHLEPICSTCVDGKKGYNSVWTCDTCPSRELSKKDYSEWFQDEQG